MANSELSKLKILYMYDYFMKNLNAFEDDSTTSVTDIINYLEEKTGTVFERKSIYADISRINEFINKIDRVKSGDTWITMEGKKYRRNELEDEMTIDEARLIVDAINTTEFVDTNITLKFRKMFPKYFDDNYNDRALMSNYVKISKRNVTLLNNIRTAIEDRRSLKISYGYKLGNELTETEVKNISPMKLDWRNSCYYLIAIDNDTAKQLIAKGEPLNGALKRYRLDRMAQVNQGSRKEYVDFPNVKLREAAIKRIREISISAFSGGTPISLPITIKSASRKETIKAFNALSSKLKGDPNIDSSKLDQGCLRVIFTTADVPTLYTALFELTTFEGVEIAIENEDVRKKFAGYLKRSASGLSGIANK